MKVPEKLRALLDTYGQLEPKPVRFRPSSWPAESNGWLTDPAVTTPSKTTAGDRLVHARDLEQACRLMDLGKPKDLCAAFELVMAWGSGTSATRSYRNTRRALSTFAW